MEPLLLRSELTGCVYVVTKYKRVGERVIATAKYDVTEQFERLVEPMLRAPR